MTKTVKAKNNRGQARREPRQRRASGEGLRKEPLPLDPTVAAGETFLDRIAVAKRLGMKPRTVADWARQGKLPAYRLGRYLRFRWAEVEERLAATCRVKGET